MKHNDPAHFRPGPAHPITAKPATTRLFGLDVVNARSAAVIDHLLSQDRCRAHFLNAHCVNVLAKDQAYRRALMTADAVLPDGAGIELAMRLTGSRMVENLNGTDLTPRLLQEALRRGKSVFLFGGRPGTAAAAAAKLTATLPGLRIAGVRDGFDGAADAAAARRAINASGADILLVAMGVPRQDLWLAQNADRLRPALTLGVGALFDFLAGHVSRAPRSLRRARLEWVWRLAQEPRRLACRYLVGNPAFVARAVAQALPRPRLKTATDIALALGGLVALLPLMAVAALAIKLDSRGPVLFRQIRIGQNGQPFAMLKFRSMQSDAEARRKELLPHSDRDGICFKARQDPRITRVGRVLRRLSLDELPQLFNILRGDMSIVGPRPALPDEVARYPERAFGRLAAKPGLTGVWQVSGRADLGFDKMIDLDLAYVQSRSALLDMILIAMTLRAVISGRGAY